MQLKASRIINANFLKIIMSLDCLENCDHTKKSSDERICYSKGFLSSVEFFVKRGFESIASKKLKWNAIQDRQPRQRNI